MSIGSSQATAADAERMPVPKRLTSIVYDWAIRIAIVSGIGLMFYHVMLGAVLDPLLQIIAEQGWNWSVVKSAYFWIVVGLVMLAVRTWLWMRYRPFAHATEESAPALTVIIPAYNEGSMVVRSIESVVAARYPRDRLEVFVIDDGSTDDTWQHVQATARRFPELVTSLRFPCNRGKRAALEAGFRRARGVIAVTIDSDSVVDNEALLAIAGPFSDPRVGAVAGKVAVLNRFTGLLPRMVHVRFVLAFDMIRAVQSTYRSVYCTPGALSAYRLSVVHRVLDRWVNQRFLGAECTFGEDRALTNDILRERYDTVYQRSAIVHTLVPRTYGKLCKMFLRWERSYVREELRLAKILWRRPWKSLPMVLADFVVNNLRFPITYGALAALALAVIHDPVMLLRVLAAVGVLSLFYMLYYLHSERSFEFIYGILYSYFAFFGLFWIFPYAALTVRARGWLTR